MCIRDRPCFLVAILFLWLLAYMPQNLRRDRAKQPGALDLSLIHI